MLEWGSILETASLLQRSDTISHFKTNPLILLFRPTTGKAVPRESTLGSRPMPKKQFQTPAPGEYDVNKLNQSKLQTGGSIRGYTFGHPNVNYKPTRTPGKPGQKICVHSTTHDRINISTKHKKKQINFFQSKE